MLLVASSVLLGYSLIATFSDITSRDAPASTFIVLAISSSSLLFYAGGLRSPGYNWLSSVSATLIALSVVREFDMARASFARSNWTLLLGAGGLILALFSRPPVAIAGFVAMLIAYSATQDTRQELAHRISWLIFSSAALLGIFASVGIIPTNAISRLLQSLGSPSPLETQTVRGALKIGLVDLRFLLSNYILPVALLASWALLRSRNHGFRFLPQRHLKTLVALQLLVSIAISVLGLLVRVIYERSPTDFPATIMRARESQPLAIYLDALRPLVLVGTSLLLALILAVLASRYRFVLPLIAFPLSAIIGMRKMPLSYSNNGSSYCSTATECWLQNRDVGAFLAFIVLAALLAMLSDRARERAPVIVVVTFALLILSVGFGSGYGPLSQLQHAAHLAVAAGCAAIVSLVHSRKLFRMLASCSLVIVIVLVAASVVGTGKAAYGWDKRTSTHSVELLRDDSLFVSKSQKESIDELRQQLTVHGWEGGNGLLILTDPWAPGLGWLMEASLPQSLILTIGGYATTDEMLNFNMELSQTYPSSCSWIVVTSDGGRFRSQRVNSDTRSRAAIVTSELGLPQFPDGYTQVYETRKDLTWLLARHQIYKPVSC